METRKQKTQESRAPMFGIATAVWIALLAGTGGALCMELLGRRLEYPESTWRIVGCVPLFAIPVAVGYTWRGDGWTRSGKRLGKFLAAAFLAFGVVSAIIEVVHGDSDLREAAIGVAAVPIFWIAGVGVGLISRIMHDSRKLNHGNRSDN